MSKIYWSTPLIIWLSSCSPAPHSNETLNDHQAMGEYASGSSEQPMTIMPVDNALGRSFRPLYEKSPDGPQIAILQGDPDTGPSLTLFRYGRDYVGSGNLHFHTHDYRLWLIEGELKHWGEQGNEKTAPVLLSGSFVHQPSQQLHAANCVSQQCTAYVIFDGPIKTGFPDDR